jgi:putative transposase
MVFNFPKLVKQLLCKYSEHDYSVLNTRLFISCWLAFSLDASVNSMNSLFRKLNLGGKRLTSQLFLKQIVIAVQNLFKTFLMNSIALLSKKTSKRVHSLRIGKSVPLTLQLLP